MSNGTISVTPSHFKIAFKYMPRLVEQVKSLPGRRFEPQEKVWLVPSEHRMAVERFAHANRFSWGTVTNEPEQDFTIPELPELTLDIPLKVTLREYQRGGVAYNLKNKKVIIGDDMGLGKTGQAIATIVGADILFQQTGLEPVYPCLVICPSSVKLNWVSQWLFWTGRSQTMVLEDNVKKNYQLYWETGMAKVFIVNFESLKKYFVDGIDKCDAKHLRINHIKFNERINIFKSVIIDEIHKVKDAKTQQAKFTKGITTGKNYILGLTGTPVINKPKDLVSQLGIIEQMHKFGGYKEFDKRYCAGEREASNLKELNYKLNITCFYRRSKQEVAKELPPKQRQVMLCEITNRKEYNDAEKDMINYLRQYKDASDEKIRSAMAGEVMVKIGILKNISARGKIKQVTEFIDDMLEGGEKVVLFVHLKEVALAIKEHYPYAATITGGVSLEDRQLAIKRFKDNSYCNLIICSIKAAGTGVDGLQHASSTVSFIELPWHSADCDQAEDRLNRIGQTKPVQAIYFLGKNTIDEHIYDIIQSKRDMSDKITGNTDVVEVSMVDAFANLFNQK